MLKPYNIPNIIPKNTVMNTTIISRNLQVYGVFNYSIQLFFTGIPTGTFKLQGSDDPAAAALATGNYNGIEGPSNWGDIKNSSTGVTQAGDITWNVDKVGYNWVRVIYSDTSGGTSTAIITSADFNGKGY